MRFEVDHTTRFSYSAPATLGPHTVRLRPRCDIAQELRRFELHIDPPPLGSFELTDRDGNAVTRVWWDQEVPTQLLTLHTVFAVETMRDNPFDFVVFDPAARRVPAAYPPAEGAALSAYLGCSSQRAVALAEEVSSECGGEVSPFLSLLASRVRERVAHEVRMDGLPLSADETLARGRGACRDAAMVFVEACRAAGMAGRFVSGYQQGEAEPDEEQERHLHAWAEAYVPGAGWRGFDPSQGLAVADRHVAVAAGASPRDAAPTEGTFGPPGVVGRLEAHLEIRVGSA